MKKVISGVALVSLTALFAAPSFACEPMHAGNWSQKHLAEMDANHDGVVSRKEFDAFHAKHFKALDTNHDGNLSAAEMEAGHAEHSAHTEHSSHHGDMLIRKRFDAADANHDGALSREEAKATPMIAQHFDEMDANHDGLVTFAEVEAMMNGNRTMPVAQSATPAASAPAAAKP